MSKLHKIIPFILFFALCKTVVSQNGVWTNWILLHHTSKDSLFVKYFTPESSTCQGGDDVHKFQIKSNILVPEEISSIEWKIPIITCDEEDAFFVQTINISESDFFLTNGEGIFESEEFSFEASSAEYSPQNVIVLSTSTSTNSTVLLKISKKPFGIEGPRRVYFSESATYSVDGGELGSDADWHWFSDSCGYNELGVGKTITIKPDKSITLYLRAEGTYNVTDCIEKRIDLDFGSRDPLSIEGQSKLCVGEQTTLKVKGGTLGVGAEWIWYEDGCTDGKKIGQGEMITIIPTSTKNYSVRAEGKINTTNCAAITIFVYNQPSNPDSIIVSRNKICNEEPVMLRVAGGKLTNDAEWIWMKNQCDGEIIGRGPVLSIVPENSLEVFVKADGYCKEWNDCKTTKIHVLEKPEIKDSIERPTTIYYNENIELKIPSSGFKEGNTYLWYDGKCGQGPVIGYGPQININVRKQTELFVLAKNLCGTSTCTSIKLNPLKSKNSSRYSPKSFTHFEFTLGAEYLSFRQEGKFTDKNTIVYKQHQMVGSGINSSIQFHPIFKESFSLGLGLNAGIGVSPYQIWGSKRPVENLNIEEKFNYKKAGLTMEGIIGSKPVKLIGIIQKSIISNNYDGFDNKTSTNVMVTNSLAYQRTLLGIRFGSYSGGKCLDLMYTFLHETSAKLFSIDYSAIKNEIPGLSLSYWKINAFHLKLDYSLSEPGQKWSEASIKKSFLNIQLNYHLDRFK